MKGSTYSAIYVFIPKQLTSSVSVPLLIFFAE